MSENKTNTNETENNVVENTTAETQNQNIEVEDSGDYIAFSNPEKDKQKSNKFVAGKGRRRRIKLLRLGKINCICACNSYFLS